MTYSVGTSELFQDGATSRLAQRYKEEYDWVDTLAVEMCTLSADASTAHKDALRHQLQLLGMESSTGYSVLRALYFAPDHCMNQSEIGNYIQLTSASITYLIDNLERQRLVKRKIDKADRRVKMIFLTPRGLATCDSVIPAVAQLMNRAAAGFTEDEKLQFVDFLNRFRRNSEAEMEADYSAPGSGLS